MQPSAAPGVRPSVRDRSDEAYWAVGDEDDEDGGPGGASSLELSPEELTLLPLEPAWTRPAPPLLEPAVDEVVWLQVPHILCEPMWDYTMCADTSLGSEVRELIAKAVKAPLPSSQQQVIFSGLEQDAKLVYHCGLTPRKLP